VVEHLPHNPKVKGLSPAVDANAGKDKIEKTRVFGWQM
jgi:hypothetical protein